MIQSPSPAAAGEGRGEGNPFATDRELDAALSELEDRGLLGWDRRANRYDLHPIVRGVAWNGLDGRRSGACMPACAAISSRCQWSMNTRSAAWKT